MKNLSYFSFYMLLCLAACNSNPPPQERTHARGEAIPGEQIYTARCAACHGLRGDAGIANAANLRTSVLDSALVAERIKNGKGMMPPFRETLGDDEVRQVAGYVMTLRK